MALDSALHLKQTEAFIAERPEDIVIVRRAKVPTTAGGWKWSAGVPLAAQRVRLVASSLQGASQVRTTEDGRTASVVLTLIGLPSVDVQRGDLFTHEGVDYEVIGEPSRLPEWRVSAEVGIRA